MVPSDALVAQNQEVFPSHAKYNQDRLCIHHHHVYHRTYHTLTWILGVYIGKC